MLFSRLLAVIMACLMFLVLPATAKYVQDQGDKDGRQGLARLNEKIAANKLRLRRR